MPFSLEKVALHFIFLGVTTSKAKFDRKSLPKGEETSTSAQRRRAFFPSGRRWIGRLTRCNSIVCERFTSQRSTDPFDEFGKDAEIDPWQEQTDQIGQVEQVIELNVDEKRRRKELLDKADAKIRKPGEKIETGDAEQLQGHASLFLPSDDLMVTTFLSNHANDQEEIGQTDDDDRTTVVDDPIEHAQHLAVHQITIGQSTNVRGIIPLSAIARIKNDDDQVEKNRIDQTEQQRQMVIEKAFQSVLKELRMKDEKMPLNTDGGHEELVGCIARVFDKCPPGTITGSGRTNPTQSIVMDDHR